MGVPSLAPGYEVGRPCAASSLATGFVVAQLEGSLLPFAFVVPDPPANEEIGHRLQFGL